MIRILRHRWLSKRLPALCWYICKFIINPPISSIRNHLFKQESFLSTIFFFTISCCYTARAQLCVNWQGYSVFTLRAAHLYEWSIYMHSTNIEFVLNLHNKLKIIEAERHLFQFFFKKWRKFSWAFYLTIDWLSIEAL